MPVMYAAGGNGHVFVDASADLDDAVAIAVNAKVQRPSTCNAAETLLVHADVAAEFLPRALRELREPGWSCAWTAARARWPGELADSLVDATEEDWATEYHALILAVKVVDSLDEAIEHVNRYGSGHSEAIVTGSTELGAGVHRPGRRRVRLRQRLHALHRRRGVRHGRRDRQLDPEAARARPDRAARADHLQVRGRGIRAGPRVAALAHRNPRRSLQPAAHRPPRVRAGGAGAARARPVLLVPVGRGAAPRARGRPGRRGARWRWSSWRSATTSASRSRASSSTATGRRTPSDTLAALREAVARRRAVPDPRRRPGGGAADLARARARCSSWPPWRCSSGSAWARNAIGIKLGAAAAAPSACATSTCR